MPSHKHFLTELSRPICRTDLSFGVVLDCTDLSFDASFCSRNASVGVAFCNWTLFVHDFGWDVRAGVVFDVDDARFWVTLQYHFFMTCGQHVLRECFFCVTMTLAFAKYVPSIRREQAGVVIGVPSSPMLSVPNFDTPPGLDSFFDARK